MVESLAQKVFLEWAYPSARLRIEEEPPGCSFVEVYGDLIEIEEQKTAKSPKPPKPAPDELNQVVDPQETLMPRQVSKSDVSIIYQGETSYIVGIQIVPPGQKRGMIYLGYTAPGITTYTDVNRVKGFITFRRLGMHSCTKIVGRRGR